MSAYAISSRGLASRRMPQGVLTPMNTLLFSAGEQGACYDPEDLSTQFQDSAGTTPVTDVEQPGGKVLDKSGNGNHATQSTTTARLVLSARVNLLTKTEQLENAAWVKQFCSITPDSAIAPDGSLSADKLVEGATSGFFRIEQNTSVIAGSSYTISIGAKKAERNFIRLYEDSSSTDASAVFDLSGGSVVSGGVAEIEDLGGLWFSCRLTYTQSGSVGRVRVAPQASAIPGSYAGDGTSGIYPWGASITFASQSHLPYQRVNTATDYDTVGFPKYWKPDGVDDYLTSATGGGGTAGFFFSEVISPLGGAGTVRVLFSDAGTNTGYIVRLNASNQLELAAGNGTTYTTVATVATLAVGDINVCQAWDDGTNLNVRIGNGAIASIARPVVSAGTAGFTIGRNNGASTGYFNGQLYSYIYRKDSAPTQAVREAVAVYQRTKARLP